MIFLHKSIFVAFANELPKTLLSLIFTIVIIMFVDLFKKIPEKVEKEFNSSLKTKNKKEAGSVKFLMIHRYSENVMSQKLERANKKSNSKFVYRSIDRLPFVFCNHLK